ncbi:hypothetical protein FEM08_03830 [Flavobacterium gilvum]|nr:hypothetical protein FEM08_03830 [Flavobacterium gilvum]
MFNQLGGFFNLSCTIKQRQIQRKVSNLAESFFSDIFVKKPKYQIFIFSKIIKNVIFTLFIIQQKLSRKKRRIRYIIINTNTK